VPSGVNHANVDAIDQQPATFRNVKALHQLGQGRLAGARGPHDADDLARRDIERDVLQDWLTVEPVAEADMLKCNGAADPRQRRAAWTIGGLRCGIEDIAEAFDRYPRLVKILPDLSQAQHRLGDPTG
jgi:hypothetical protein